jgi:hypothetical protein
MALATFALVQALVADLITPIIAAVVGEPSFGGVARDPSLPRVHNRDSAGGEALPELHSHRGRHLSTSGADRAIGAADPA